MNAIDFGNSYHTFFSQTQGNIARHHFDAACTLVDEASGTSEIYYLVAPCRAEHMYRDTGCFQMPSYEFCGIWSKDEFLLIRTHWVAARDNRQYGRHRERFLDVRLDIRTVAGTRALGDIQEIIQAAGDNLPLVARTELRDAGRGLRAVLEYPVKTMNVLRDPPRFQVDTGPLIVPDFESTAAHAIERFDMAYVAYNVFDQAEFILRKPTPVPNGNQPGSSPTDYSAIKFMPARNQILSTSSPAAARASHR